MECDFVMNLDSEKKLLNDYIEFISILKKLHFKYSFFSLKTPKGSITNTELFYIFRHIKEYRPKLIFDSGYGIGRSSLILSEIMKNHGRVISSKFFYAEENFNMYIFENDYDNLTIVNQRGEIAIKNIDSNENFIAVIDGPKPSGYLYNRPGWIELMDELIQFDNLKVIFQHDISDNKNLTKLKNYFDSNMIFNFSLKFIEKIFISQFPMFGNDDTSKNNLINLASIIKIS